jgi:hypothetical protein
VVPNTHPFLTDYIQIDQHDGVYGRVRPANVKELKFLARNADEDELLEKFREWARVLESLLHGHHPDLLQRQRFLALIFSSPTLAQNAQMIGMKIC